MCSAAPLSVSADLDRLALAIAVLVDLPVMVDDNQPPLADQLVENLVEQPHGLQNRDQGKRSWNCDGKLVNRIANVRKAIGIVHSLEMDNRMPA